jgi:hypothetical protein
LDFRLFNVLPGVEVKLLTLEPEKLLNGAYRCTVLRSSAPEVEFAARREVWVTSHGVQTILPVAWNNECMRRAALDFGDLSVPFEQVSHLFDAVPIARHLIRMGRTWRERLFPCYFWYTEDADRIETFHIPPFVLEGRLYPQRVPRVVTIMARLLLRLFVIYCCARLQSSAVVFLSELIRTALPQLPSAVTIAPQPFYYLRRWALFKHAFSGQAYLYYPARLGQIFGDWFRPYPKLSVPIPAAITAFDDALNANLQPFAGAYSRVADACSHLSSIATAAVSAAKLTYDDSWYGTFKRAVSDGRRAATITLKASGLFTTATIGVVVTSFSTYIPLYYVAQAVKECVIHLAYRAFRHHFFFPVETLPARIPRNYMPPTIAAHPRADELAGRIALRDPQNFSKSMLLDLYRRMWNAGNWPHVPSWADVELSAEILCSSYGTTPIPAHLPGFCITCLLRAPTYRGECKPCYRARRAGPPLYTPVDVFVARVGRVGLYSEHFKLPHFVLKPDVKFTNRTSRREYICPSADWVAKIVARDPPVTTCRGFNAGPIFLGQRPKLFPEGESVAIQAFCVRLGIARAHVADPQVWLIMREFLYPYLTPIEHESEEQFLSHFHGPKLELMLAARDSVNNGDMIWSNKTTLPLRTGGFRKTEKSYSRTYHGLLDWSVRPTLKPRFICCPRPEFNFFVGPHTHAQLKWLAQKFHSRRHMFYAGCANPDQLNDWLNWTHSELPDAVSLVDDIEAIDSNHSFESFEYAEGAFTRMFPGAPPDVQQCVFSERNLKLKIGNWFIEVCDVNGSGVPDTSWKNGVICLPARVLAICFAICTTFTTMSGEDRRAFIKRVLSHIYTSAAGDDGLTRMPRILLGFDVFDPIFIARYQLFWNLLGFTVKVALLPEHRWRMATYLAARPVWAGSRYEWAPEPARRLRGAFWIYDKKIHPTAWGRGIATQLLFQAAHQPVIAAISKWYLSITNGPVAQVTLTDNPHSPWINYRTSGVANSRADDEFCVDYCVPHDSLNSFREMLQGVCDHLVTVNHFVIERIFSEES